MYDLIDRPIDDLPAFERHLLDTTRRWVHAFSMIGAPPRDCGGDAFAAVMGALDRGSATDLVIPRPCFGKVDEIEAVLLGIWRLVRADRLAAARRAAAALVDDAAAGDMIGGMVRVATELA